MTIAEQATTILLADDDPRVLSAISELLGDDPTFLVVATATTAMEAIEAACRERPALALLDVSMPGSGQFAATELRRLCPQTTVVALSATDDYHSVQSMLAAGAVRFLRKGDPSIDLIDALSEIIAASD